MFDSDVAEPNNESVRRRRRVIAVWVLIVVAIIIAVISIRMGLGWVEQRRIATALHSGMSREDVIGALGDPRAVFDCTKYCDRWSLRDHPIEPLNAAPNCFVYRPGANRVTVVVFDGGTLARRADLGYEGPSDDEDKAYVIAVLYTCKGMSRRGDKFGVSLGDGVKEGFVVKGEGFYGASRIGIAGVE
jgi:hypothetical protein